MEKTVLEMDLAGYSQIARVLEESLNVQAVKAFEDQIQGFVDQGLAALNLRREDVVLGTAGDNAILLFDQPAAMHHFAEVVQAATRSYNRTRTVAEAQRWFRMGAATGTVLIEPEHRRIVGTTIARAVRLEAAAEKGELLIDEATWNGLPDELKRTYGPTERVAGKRDEQFIARRCTMVPHGEVGPGPVTRSATLRTAGIMLGLLAVLGAALVIWRPWAPQDREERDGVRAPDRPAEPSHSGSGTAEPVGPTTQPAASVMVRIWDPANPTRRNLRVSDEGALPLRPGDQIRIEVESDQPVHVYLLWIAPSGRVFPVFPWAPGDWTRQAAADQPRTRISLPERSDLGWPMGDTRGMETILLLSRSDPLPAEVNLRELLGDLPPTSTLQDPRSLVWLDRHGIVSDPATDREPLFFSPGLIGDPVLILHRQLTERLTPYFDGLQAVSFANHGASERQSDEQSEP